jgi:hypothetical protein
VNGTKLLVSLVGSSPSTFYSDFSILRCWLLCSTSLSEKSKQLALCGILVSSICSFKLYFVFVSSSTIILTIITNHFEVMIVRWLDPMLTWGFYSTYADAFIDTWPATWSCILFIDSYTNDAFLFLRLRYFL